MYQRDPFDLMANFPQQEQKPQATITNQPSLQNFSGAANNQDQYTFYNNNVIGMNAPTTNYMNGALTEPVPAACKNLEEVEIDKEACLIAGCYNRRYKSTKWAMMFCSRECAIKIPNFP